MWQSLVLTCHPLQTRHQVDTESKPEVYCQLAMYNRNSNAAMINFGYRGIYRIVFILYWISDVDNIPTDFADIKLVFCMNIW